MGCRLRRLGAVLAIAVLALAASLTAAPVHAQAPAPAAGSLVLSSSRGLDFGRFVASAGSAGSVTVAASGLRSGAGGVILLPPGGGAAQFHLDRAAGGVNPAVSISLPAGNSVVLSNGAQRMSAGAFQAWPASIGAVPDGGIAIAVGATLEVAAGQAPGNYQGAFALTVNYE